ncbi:11393_t:CDS:2 [Diversispora eburnea]|uniref:11393_t:CDS:1 n=1 Tax=Diversispora eburnea TaxID=1213867 RepID=A0A9N9B5G5_9GLOM|nr:11393_t:CDS:2 [Diversispora eburnea]
MSRKKDLLENALKNRFITPFDYNTFEEFVPIGRGGFGQVMRAYSKSLEKYVALKNPFEETYYLVLQYAKDGDLKAYLQNNFENLNWQIKINMAKDIARGLSFIHKKNIVHRDLVRLSRSLDTSSNSLIGGTFAYTDPRYLKNIGYYKRNKESDVYSLGVLFWELSSGRPPFKNFAKEDVYKKVTSGERETPIDGTPTDYINIYSNAWDDDPIQRKSIEDIRKSLEKIQFENLFYVSNKNIQSNASIENIEPLVEVYNIYSQDLVSNVSNEESDQTSFNLKYGGISLFQ